MTDADIADSRGAARGAAAMNQDRWNVELVASYLGLTPKHTRDAVIKKPGFPKPVVNASRRTRLWNAEDVKQWAAKPH